MSKYYVFSKLSKDAQIKMCTIPQCVSIEKNPDKETKNQLITRQERFLTLPELIKDKLVSEETSKEIQEIGKIYNLELLQLADISRAIRSFYFNEIKLEDIPQILSKEMGIDLETAQKISSEVIQKIINDDSLEKERQANLKNIPFSEALKSYPEIGEQLLTSEKITLKNFFEPVRPSVKNWLSDYIYSLGYGTHSAIERGNFIFQNENVKKLSVSDREKLSFLLKAQDENSVVAVNIGAKQIVFPEEEIQKRAGVFEQKNISFSSPQKMPFENKKPEAKPMIISSQNFRNNSNQNPTPAQNKKPFRII